MCNTGSLVNALIIVSKAVGCVSSHGRVLGVPFLINAVNGAARCEK